MSLQEVTTSNFEDTVAASQEPVLVDVWGHSCKPCLALMPAVEKMAQRLEGEVRIVKLNAPENRELCRSLKVLGMPTFLLFREGQEVARLTEKEPDQARLEGWLKDALKEPQH